MKDTKEIIKEIKLLMYTMFSYESDNGNLDALYLNEHNKKLADCFYSQFKELSLEIMKLKDKIKIFFLKLENNKNKEIIKEIQWLIDEASCHKYLYGNALAKSPSNKIFEYIVESSLLHFRRVEKIDKLFEKIV